MTYIQHFNNQASEYLQYRPTYPDELYLYLANQSVEHQLAWDCATGNGQAAVKLAEYFDKVIATDISPAQLAVAIKKDNIYYECCLAEITSIQSSSVDLITVAQALHWFNFEDFYREVKRVAKPNALIAVWTYPIGNIDPRINNVINKLYDIILGDTYWPKERKFIDDEYKTVPFPFKRMQTPQFIMQKKMNLAELIGYLNTWSAVKEYQKRNGKNPIDLIKADLLRAWENESHEFLMQWPIHLLLAKVHK